jgi:2-dehydro-3-deoxyphosphogluconate aldolase/(4S)-4-hydroxy-2-oxoglutarate aldolase
MTLVMEIAETQVVARLARSRIIALGTFDLAEQVETTARALMAGGVDVLELENPSLGLLRAARRIDGLIVGAGHVHTVEQAEAAVSGGAHFATAPATNMEVVHACRELELPFFPGVATPSEIERLALLGVRTQRLFPAEPLGGPALLAAVAAIYPDVRFIPAGGIGPEVLRGYLQIPAVLAVAAAGVVRGDLLRAHNYDRVEWLARDVQRARR